MLDQDWRQKFENASYGDKYKMFVAAASAGNVEQLAYCVEEKKMSTSHEEAQPLCMAACHGHLEAVKYLHRNGNYWDLSDNHYAPISYAAGEGHYDVTEYLVNCISGNRSCTPTYMLMAAARNGHKDVLEMMLNKGVGQFEQTGPWLLQEIASTKHYDVAEMLLEKGAKSAKALEAAVGSENLPMLTLLLDYEVQDDDDKALHRAKETKQDDMVHLLHRHKRESRRLELMSDMLENRKDVMGMFLESCAIEAINQKRDSDGNSGILLLAREGLFFTLCHKNPETAKQITVDDLFCRNLYFQSPISVMTERGQLNRLFMLDMWLDRRNDIMQLWDRLSNDDKKQVDFDTVMSRITKHEMRQRSTKKAVQMKRRTPKS